MIVTSRTKAVLAERRQKTKLIELGYEEITMSFGIGLLWELDRGRRTDHKIVDSVVGVGGKNLFVKVEKNGCVPIRSLTKPDWLNAVLTPASAKVTVTQADARP